MHVPSAKAALPLELLRAICPALNILCCGMSKSEATMSVCNQRREKGPTQAEFTDGVQTAKWAITGSPRDARYLSYSTASQPSLNLSGNATRNIC